MGQTAMIVVRTMVRSERSMVRLRYLYSKKTLSDPLRPQKRLKGLHPEPPKEVLGKRTMVRLPDHGPFQPDHGPFEVSLVPKRVQLSPRGPKWCPTRPGTSLSLLATGIGNISLIFLYPFFCFLFVLMHLLPLPLVLCDLWHWQTGRKHNKHIFISIECWKQVCFPIISTYLVPVYFCCPTDDDIRCLSPFKYLSYCCMQLVCHRWNICWAPYFGSGFGALKLFWPPLTIVCDTQQKFNDILYVWVIAEYPLGKIHTYINSFHLTLYMSCVIAQTPIWPICT